MAELAHLPPQRRAWVRRRLLTWFGRHARHLPWRAGRDPYAIWVSEVMLQQTQVVVVIPYFERFLQAFPDMAALAQADEQDVLRLWEGLGYYRRARALHQTARVLCAEHGGAIPNDPKLLRGLPGLGRYTVNAVLSQAFDRRLPIVEANSARVLCRLLGVRADPATGPARRRLWDAATTLLPARQTGLFNQALMELGALVCTPAKPRCGDCPLARHCQARRAGSQDEIPVRSRAAAPALVDEVAVVLRRGSAVLLAQRPATGRWASLWEFPHTELSAGETHTQAAERFLAELGVKADFGDELCTLKHAVTRFRITLVCLEAQHRRGRFQSKFYVGARWLPADEVARFPVSSPQRRLARTVAEPRQARLF